MAIEPTIWKTMFLWKIGPKAVSAGWIKFLRNSRWKLSGIQQDFHLFEYNKMCYGEGTKHEVCIEKPCSCFKGN